MQYEREIMFQMHWADLEAARISLTKYQLSLLCKHNKGSMLGLHIEAYLTRLGKQGYNCEAGEPFNSRFKL